MDGSSCSWTRRTPSLVMCDNLNALKSNYQNLAAEIKQAEAEIDFDEWQYEWHDILARHQVAPQTAL